MSCLFVNGRVLASGAPQVNLAENRLKRGLAEATLSAINRPAIHTGTPVLRRGGRVVDRAALEMRSTGDRTGGSNPSLSAITFK